MTPGRVLLSWGSGGGDCLLHDNEKDYCTPREAVCQDVAGSEVIVCGGTHCLALANAAVIAWGDNRQGQCAAGPSLPFLVRPARIQLQHRISRVACGWSHSIAITEGGQVLSWGNVKFIGRDGIGYEPNLVAIPYPATDVSCGFSSSAVIANDRLWLWGENRFGEIELPASKQACRRPLAATLPAAVIPAQVACGWRHVLIRSVNGRVLARGTTKYGLMGDGGVSDEGWATISCGYDPIVQIATGWSHCLALTDRGAVLAWGRGDFGQQGDGQLVHHSTTHRIEFGDERIDAIHCGSEHSVCIAATGVAYSFGWNEHGNLGNGEQINRGVPTRIACRSPIVVFSTGGAACLAIIDERSADSTCDI